MMSKKRPRRSKWLTLGIPALVAIVALAVWFFFLTSVPPADPPPGRISARQAYELIERHSGDPSFIVLDVRTPEEYAQGHVSSKGVIPSNLNFYAEDFREQLAKLDRTKTYLVYCHTGNRSSQAVALMKELGFQRIYDIEGGTVAWQSAGLPLGK